jgi:hypothetical protein
MLDLQARGLLTVTNPIESMILQDKRIFAIIWEHIAEFSSKDQQIIRDHIPHTLRRQPENSDDYLAKWRFGRYGHQIYTEALMTHIDTPTDFIFQKRIEPLRSDGDRNFLVFGVFTNYTTPLSVVVRKQRPLTTADEDSRVTLCYIQP